MADIFDPAKRSEIMSLIRGKGTKPEALVFKYLRINKIYFQKHYNKVLGSPDIALPRKKKAVFIDGDFWHGRTFERRKDKLPEYWVKKISRNMERDNEYRLKLKNMGWKLLPVWESELTKVSTRLEALERIKKFLVEQDGGGE